MLVIHGETDHQVSVKGTVNAVEETKRLFPESQLEFVRLPSVSHVPAMTASQRVWMDWIADRFAGREVGKGVTTRTLSPARPKASYQQEHNWYLEAATEPYHAP